MSTREVNKNMEELPNVKNDNFKIKMENEGEEMAEYSEDNLLEYATEYKIKKEEIEIEETQYHLHHSLDSDDNVPLQSIRIKKENEAVGQNSVAKAVDPTECSEDSLLVYAKHYDIKKEEIEIKGKHYHLHHSSDSDDDVPLQSIRIKQENKSGGQESVLEMGGLRNKEITTFNTMDPCAHIPSTSSTPMETEDALPSTSAIPTTAEKNALRNREYRKRVAATRTPEQAAAFARKAAERQRKAYHLRRAANLALANGTVETTKIVQTSAQRKRASRQRQAERVRSAAQPNTSSKQL